MFCFKWQIMGKNDEFFIHFHQKKNVIFDVLSCMH